MDANEKFTEICKLSIKIEDEFRKFNDLDGKYKTIFVSDFRYEINWYHNKYNKNGSLSDVAKKAVEDNRRPSINQSRMRSDTFKQLYRQLAKKTHPDTITDVTEDSIEEFKEVQEAYSHGDITTLLRSAAEHNISIEIQQSDIDEIKDNIREQTKYMNKIKASARWLWAACDRSMNQRYRIWTVLGLDERKFLKWINNKEVDLSVYHDESLNRWSKFNESWVKEKHVRRKSKTGPARRRTRGPRKLIN